MGLTLLAAMSSVLPAAAAGGGSEPFGLTPMPAADGRSAPYFMMTVAAGQSATASALISNRGQTAEQLRISRSTAATAANGGTSFIRAFQSCSGVGCWVTGVPPTVTLPAGTGERLLFRVSVPAGTAPGQYLPGLTAEAAQPPPPVAVGSNGKAAGRAIIVEQITVGVAVTVGLLSTLTTRLAIRGVSATVLGSAVRLEIDLENTGQTFAHGTGSASCVLGAQRRTFPVTASTILPHDRAMIAVATSGLPLGVTMPCAVRLDYGTGLTASWSGPVTVPDPPPSRIVHTGPGAYSVIPAAGTPWWATALIIIGMLLVAAAAVLLLIRMRERGKARQ